MLASCLSNPHSTSPLHGGGRRHHWTASHSLCHWAIGQTVSLEALRQLSAVEWSPIQLSLGEGVGGGGGSLLCHWALPVKLSHSKHCEPEGAANSAAQHDVPLLALFDTVRHCQTVSLEALRQLSAVEWSPIQLSLITRGGGGGGEAAHSFVTGHCQSNCLTRSIASLRARRIRLPSMTCRFSLSLTLCHCVTVSLCEALCELSAVERRPVQLSINLGQTDAKLFLCVGVVCLTRRWV